MTRLWANAIGLREPAEAPKTGKAAKAARKRSPAG